MKRTLAGLFLALFLDTAFVNGFASNAAVIHDVNNAKNRTHHHTRPQSKQHSALSKAKHKRARVKHKAHYPVSIVKKHPNKHSHKPSNKHRHNHALKKGPEYSTQTVSISRLNKHPMAVETNAPLFVPVTEQITLTKPKIRRPMKQAFNNYWFISFGGGIEYPHFHSTTSVLNGSGFTPPSNKDIYALKNDNHLTLALSGGYRVERNSHWFPAYSIAANYQYLFQKNIGGNIMLYSLPSFTNYTYSLDISSNVLLISGKANLFTSYGFMPYINGGIGGAAVTTGGYGESAFSGVTPRTSAGYADKTSFKVAYELGAGVDYRLNKEFILSAGYNYLNLGNVTTGNGQGTWAGQSLNLGAIHTSEVLVSATYLIDG